jgi:hypothetical protein
MQKMSLMLVQSIEVTEKNMGVQIIICFVT